MSTDTSDTKDGVEREQVERSYTLRVFPSDSDNVAEIRDAEPKLDDDEHYAQRRSFADWLTSMVDGRDPYETQISKTETKVISVGATDIEVGPHNDLYEKLMEAAANYGGQHPLGFCVEVESETKFARSPSSAFKYSVKSHVLDSIDTAYQPSDEYEEFRLVDESTWTAPTDQEVSLSFGYTSVTTAEHPDENVGCPCVAADISITADAEPAVELLDQWIFDQLTDGFDALAPGQFTFSTGEKKTEVCKRSE